MATIYKEVEIDVSLDDFSDDEIADEYEERELGDSLSSDRSSRLLVTVLDIYNAKTLGKNYEALLDQLIFDAIGRIV
jgi:hypothetical protein